MIADFMAQLLVLQLGQKFYLFRRYDCLKFVHIKSAHAPGSKIKLQSYQNRLQYFGDFYTGHSTKQLNAKKFLHNNLTKKKLSEYMILVSEVALISLSKNSFCSASCRQFGKMKKTNLKQNENPIQRVGKDGIFLKLAGLLLEISLRLFPSGNPLEQPCQPLENSAHPSSFIWINPLFFSL